MCQALANILLSILKKEETVKICRKSYDIHVSSGFSKCYLLADLFEVFLLKCKKDSAIAPFSLLPLEGDASSGLLCGFCTLAT